MIFVDPIEASDMKWQPGMWPEVFVKGTQTWYRREATYDHEGEVVSFKYQTRDNLYQLEVFND